MPKRSETYCCDMRGLLSFLVLFLLSKKPMHGQQIAEEIEKRKGSKPSPGTIYPALKSLKKLGLIEEKKAGKTIIYHLTKQGEKELEIAKKNFCQAFMDIFKN
jgi:DNA-binding PadR family transcriptional regulator